MFYNKKSLPFWGRLLVIIYTYNGIIHLPLRIAVSCYALYVLALSLCNENRGKTF